MSSKLLADIASFKQKGSLKPADTHVTTAGGIKYVEKKDSSGHTFLEAEEEKGLGFCPDHAPDLIVGVAMEGVLVGSQDVAQDLSLLSQHEVTHVLNVAYGIPNAYPNMFEYLDVEMFDDLQQDLLSKFPQCQDFIERGREKGTVLIHCNAGCSRSVSIALAYVMHKERVSLDKALQTLRKTRPSAQPNQGFLQQLRTLEDNLGIAKPSELC